MTLKKKGILGKKENDPDWIKDIACYFFTYQKKGKANEYADQLRELFLEYKRDGLRSKDAWNKAKRVIACFEFEK